jgi:hypothetical protein
MLTDTAARNAKPGTKAVKLFDSGGLYLEVAPAVRLALNMHSRRTV